jgi:hypothetical protein
METQVKVCDRHKNVAGSNQLMGSQPSTLGNELLVMTVSFV